MTNKFDTEEFYNLLKLKCIRDMDKESKSFEIEFNEVFNLFLKNNPEISKRTLLSKLHELERYCIINCLM